MKTNNENRNRNSCETRYFKSLKITTGNQNRTVEKRKSKSKSLLQLGSTNAFRDPMFSLHFGNDVILLRREKYHHKLLFAIKARGHSKK